jgi:SsrA-binding protein
MRQGIPSVAAVSSTNSLTVRWTRQLLGGFRVFSECCRPIHSHQPQRRRNAALPTLARGGYHTGTVKNKSKTADYEGVKIVSQNRTASYNYHILDKVEAGVVLLGTEVKSLREGKGTLRESYAEIRAGEVWLINCHIPEYLPGGTRNHDPLRKRKMLLKRREIEKLQVQTQQKGMTLVPLKIYFRDGIAKCELAIAKGKKFHDRRESERKKEAKREADEAMYRSRHR